MRANIPTIAALAAGGLALSSLMRRGRGPGAGVSMDRYVERDVQVRMPVSTLAAFAAVGFGGMLLSSQLRKRADLPSNIEESIDLNVPVSVAYNQWTQFEEFPRFMASVEEVRQIDDTHLHFRANVAGKMKEWDAEVTEQIPDQRIAWRSIGGVQNAGVVTFHKITDSRTRVMLQMDYKPETAGEKVGDAVGGVRITTKGNLRRFKDLVEQRGSETGAWRGTVTQH